MKTKNNESTLKLANNLVILFDQYNKGTNDEIVEKIFKRFLEIESIKDKEK